MDGMKKRVPIRLFDCPLEEGENGCGNCIFRDWDDNFDLVCGRPGEFDPFTPRLNRDSCDYWRPSRKREGE